MCGVLLLALLWLGGNEPATADFHGDPLPEKLSISASLRTRWELWNWFEPAGTQDNDYDRASHLDRPSVFRLNIGVSRDTYRSLFGPPPAPPGDAGGVATGHDFAALDQLMPHPVYAPQSWVCVLNPSAATFRGLQPLLAEAYARAANRLGLSS